MRDLVGAVGMEITAAVSTNLKVLKAPNVVGWGTLYLYSCRSKPCKPQSTCKCAQWIATSQHALAESQASESLFVVKDQSSRPYQVELQVNECPLTMEMDTGARVFIAPESVLSSLQPSVSFQPSNIVLKTYTGQYMYPSERCCLCGLHL